MKIVFLDIDGVLNSLDFMLTSEHFTEWPRGQIDPAAVNRLNRLIAATNVKIVISSSWRKLIDYKEIERVLAQNRARCIAKVIGQTPDFYKLQFWERPTYPEKEGKFVRGDEIQAWLDENGKDVEKFVIFDDDEDMGHLTHRLIKTDSQTGLLSEHIRRAIAMLT